MKTRMMLGICMLLGACLPNGCKRTAQLPWETLEACHAENTDLKLRLETLVGENDRLAEQVQTLSTLDTDLRLKSLATFQDIHLGKRTGFYDLNEDGRNESLVVYLEPIDTAHDYVKAVGECTVELWNLDASAQEALLKRWILGPSDLHGVWGGTIFNAYYRLAFETDGLSIQDKPELTVKAAFKDYFTGKTATAQAVLKP